MNTIIGTWRLISLDLSDNEKTINPFGQNVTGLLIYHENGYMSGIISGENRPDVSSPAMMGIQEHERIAISKNFISYAGKYTIENNNVIHNIMVSFVPNLINEESHISSFFFSGNKLITVSKPIHRNDKKITISLSWERAI